MVLYSRYIALAIVPSWMESLFFHGSHKEGLVCDGLRQALGIIYLPLPQGYGGMQKKQIASPAINRVTRLPRISKVRSVLRGWSNAVFTFSWNSDLQIHYSCIYILVASWLQPSLLAIPQWLFRIGYMSSHLAFASWVTSAKRSL